MHAEKGNSRFDLRFHWLERWRSHRWVVGILATVALLFPIFDVTLIPGMDIDNRWRFHPIATVLLAWRWRWVGLASGIAATLSVLLSSELWPAPQWPDDDSASIRRVASIAVVNTIASIVSGWIVIQWGRADDLRAQAERSLAQAHAERSARQTAEQRYRHLVDHLPAVTYIDAIDDLSTAQFTSPQITELTGYTPDEWLSIPDLWIDLLHPDDRNRVLAEHRRTNETLEPFTMEYRLQHRDGRVVWVRDNAVVTVSADGSRAWQGVMTDITSEREARHALQEAETRFRTLVEQMPAMIYIIAYERPHRMLYMSPHGQELFGYTPEQWSTQPGFIYSIVHPEDRETLEVENERYERTGDQYSLEYRIIAADGRTIWVRDDCVLVRDEAGNPMFYQGIILDITAQKATEGALRASEERFRSAFDDAAIPMAIASLDFRFLRVNKPQCDWIGYTEEELLAINIRDLIHPDDLNANDRSREELFSGQRSSYQTERRYIHKNGSVIWGMVNISLVRDDDGTPLYFIGQTQDITERKQLEERLAHQAFHDALTGLPNRALFMDRLDHAIARADRAGATLAILYIDLDGFKEVNDTFGHAAGDEVLAAVGQRLLGWIRTADTAARLGGDEFTLLIEDVDCPSTVTRIADRIIGGMSAPISVRGIDVMVRSSIGVAFRDPGSNTPDELLHQADIALYRAKHAGKDQYAVFDDVRTLMVP